MFKMKYIILGIVIVIIGIFICVFLYDKKGLILENESKLIYEISECPNSKAVANENEKVYYYIKIYQEKDNTIIVKATSNSELMKDLQYTIKYDKVITQDNIEIKWLTLMGQSNASENNQVAIADIIISDNKEVVSERKVNFVSKIIEIIVDRINKNTK